MVGFLLGEKLAGERWSRQGGLVVSISVGVVLSTAAIVFVVMLAMGVGVPFALLLAGIAPPTAPAATMDVVRESRASGPFSSTLLGIVALDDALGMALFSLLLAFAELWSGSSGTSRSGSGSVGYWGRGASRLPLSGSRWPT